MVPTEEELSHAFCEDTALQAAVLSGQMTEEEWKMYLWYARRLGYMHRDRPALPATCLMVLAYRTDVFRLMLQHNRYPHDAVAEGFLRAQYGQSHWLGVLENENPVEFRDADQQFMLGLVPEHLLGAYRDGTLLCGELMRANPKAFLPCIANL